MEPFFSSLFPATDKSVWLTQVQKELKDAAAYESLRWPTDEGFTLEPYYTADDLTDLPLTAIQASQKQIPGWINIPEYAISSEKSDNLRLRDVLTRGADALVVTLSTKPDLALLLNGIKLSETPIFFRLTSAITGNEVVDFVQALKNIAPYQLKGGSLADTSAVTAEVTRLTANSPQFRTVCVGSHRFHNAGATATQELAFTLASLADTYDTLTNAGLSIDQLLPKTMLSVSVGTGYFLEIAKLRALRVLFSRFLAAYSTEYTSYPLFLHCQTSTFYDSTATSYTNMLRATTEAMSAVIGGCDALTIHPYNSVAGQSDEFSERIARNISVLLKEESYLGKVADPSAGTYYIEKLTYTLAEAAWALFLAVEKQGGLTKALANGFIASELARSYQTKVDAVRNGKVLVGVNKFRFDETTQQNPTSHVSEIPIDSLPNRRLAEPFE